MTEFYGYESNNCYWEEVSEDKVSADSNALHEGVMSDYSFDFH
eukprot:CAMPEP_0114577894 /NCGR_PEP_ID=MMETSP0125-20121206/2500_1 /TAXON_ID=485358 ORGANISM="Aristerostoma sp., Strain ATCC 50986" /NCGR_SAMPLE_ID=MMETSP0125 /ASSEMBLY_ACC=CAM_ASM_000245 /LENGTH=42 /DNA_ID= /DNA_START= /DNA_END= /DNA_ORIENTATION=